MQIFNKQILNKLFLIVSSIHKSQVSLFSGPNPAMLRSYFFLCIQKSFITMLGGTYGYQGYDPGLAACKTLPACLTCYTIYFGLVSLTVNLYLPRTEVQQCRRIGFIYSCHPQYLNTNAQCHMISPRTISNISLSLFMYVSLWSFMQNEFYKYYGAKCCIYVNHRRIFYHKRENQHCQTSHRARNTFSLTKRGEIVEFEKIVREETRDKEKMKFLLDRSKEKHKVTGDKTRGTQKIHQRKLVIAEKII